MILVVGSTGLLGSEIVRQLGEASQPVRALVRQTSAGVRPESKEVIGLGK